MVDDDGRREEEDVFEQENFLPSLVEGASLMRWLGGREFSNMVGALISHSRVGFEQTEAWRRGRWQRPILNLEAEYCYDWLLASSFARPVGIPVVVRWR